MSLHVHILEMNKVLGQVDQWLDKALAFATAKKFDANTLLHARIAPDMLPFTFQIRTACDTAKGAAARITGKDNPVHQDNETTIDELKKRIAATRAYLGGFKKEDFDGADERRVTTPRWEGKTMSGSEYMVEHACPNFFFHTTMTYALLRHAGVELGKRDFLGPLPLK